MAAAHQQPAVYYVAAAPTSQPYVIIQTQAQSEPSQLYLRKTHKVLGILQMIVGCLCVTMEIIGACVGPVWGIVWTGFYTGIIFFIAGLLGYLAFKKNNYCLIVACMVMSIIAIVFSVTGIMLSIMEMKAVLPSRYTHRRIRMIQNVKEAVIIAACSFEFIVSIVHASYTCATCCRCCWPNSRRSVTSRAVPATVIVHQPNQLGYQQSSATAFQQSNPAVEERPLTTKADHPPSDPHRDVFPASDLFEARSSSPPPYSE